MIQRSCCHEECAMRNRPRSLPPRTSVAARMPWRRSLRMRVLLAATAVLVALLTVLGTVFYLGAGGGGGGGGAPPGGGGARPPPPPPPPAARGGGGGVFTKAR
ncbi:hypothetical protein, partial [Xanthomonas euvesicatoria]|uniref:hypothetical protein n=1 Tax=Xanthomonas euvesicatoria TaxID=456327 RepID=UPI003D2F57FC